MKLFWFCTFIAIPSLVRSVDVQCAREIDKVHHGIREFNNKSCEITKPVTVTTWEKVNIVSKINLNFINELRFVPDADNRSQISRVPREIFEQLPNLEILNLDATVEVLNKGDFEKAVKLKHLTIENQLKTIPAGILSSAKNLEKLVLSDNKIAKIEDNAFSGLIALLRVDLNKNKLTIIKQNTFSGLVKLEYLNLARNQIELIDENALNLPNLKELNVMFNNLTNLPDNLFWATPLLRDFVASYNEIRHIGKSLYELKNLETLSLSHNNLTDVDLVAFSQMPVLRLLFLNFINLTSEKISKIEIKEPSKSVLSLLSISHNELANNDDWKKFAIFPQLKFIEVEDTKYSKIDLDNKTLRQQFPKLTKVTVSSGEWSCDWLKNFVESSRKDGIYIEPVESSDTSGKEVNGIGCV